jgi:signal transduction histidine kinase
MPSAYAAEVTDLLRQRESLREVIEAISSELKLAPLLEQILARACTLLKASHGSIGLYDEPADVMEIVATHGLPPGELGKRIPPGEGLAGLILAERRPVLRERYDSIPSPIWPEVAEHAVIAQPLLWRGRLIGFFGLGGPPPLRFREHDLETLALFGRHAAIAIENARRYEWEQRRTERLALITRVAQIVTAGLQLEQLLQTAADAIHEILGYPSVDIPLLDPDGRTLVIRTRGGRYKRLISGEARLPVSQGIMGAAVAEKRTQLVNDVAGDPRYVRPVAGTDARAELAVPILLGGDALGVVNVESDAPFTEDDAASLEIVADHLAVAIHNARVYDRAQQVAVVEERQRLSRDLHDSVTQHLFSVTLIAQSLASACRRDPVEGERMAQRLLELSRVALAEMRGLLFDLRADGAPGDPEPLSGISRVRREGLPSALRQHAAEVSGDTFRVDVEVRGYRPQPFVREEALFRIAQEALGNVVKHAGAHQVRIALALDASGVRLTVADDGRGFEPGELLLRAAAGGAGRVGGLGFVSMRERAEALHGTLSIQARPGGGTAVEVTLPASPGATT